MSGETMYELLAGSWIVDAGPSQMKVLETYTPLGGGTLSAAGMGFNFDWSLGGLKPTATHGTIQCGIVQAEGRQIEFVLIQYALDEAQMAVYILKAVGNKTVIDRDTISVENLVFHIYNDPERANPITDIADFTIPSSGTFPPVREYRVKLHEAPIT